MAESDKERDKELFAYMVRVASLSDLARCTFTIGMPPKQVFACNEGKNYRLFVFGERFEDATIVYYFDSPKRGRYIRYCAKDDGGRESCEMRDEIGEEERRNYKIQKMAILELSGLPFEVVKEYKGKARSMRVAGLKQLMISYLSYVHGGEGVLRTYRFRSGSKSMVAIPSFIKNALAYAEYDLDNGSHFISYDYNTDGLKESEAMPDERAAVCIIDIAEPFPFFRPA
ncbi:MAG: hypothetical protein KGH78_02645 [Candidatus Micrarchaeota archaeon]|nr:hypothetical protein [Candidatus Micrarchaeota archaeon]MDE1846629.1 hypothetical protein [Candidatus Micrarchaeota archaeon]